MNQDQSSRESTGDREAIRGGDTQLCTLTPCRGRVPALPGGLCSFICETVQQVPPGGSWELNESVGVQHLEATCHREIKNITYYYVIFFLNFIILALTEKNAPPKI